MTRKPVVLCILDGWGLRDESDGNAPRLAHTPNFDKLMETCPSASLAASGEDVGLPPGQIGNSEVGHTNIGAGRVVWMDLPRINRDIADGTFDQKPALRDFVAALRASGGTAHLCGLLSDGGVHAHQDHIVALSRILSSNGIPVSVHGFLDGRDVGPRTGKGSVESFLAAIADLPEVRLATLCGRFYAMDRDRRWDRVARASELLLRGEGVQVDDPLGALDAAYTSDTTDEFIEPMVIDHSGIAAGDGLLSGNFRADRMRELLGALLDPDFDAYDTGPRPKLSATLGMVSYSSVLDPLMPAIYPPETIKNTLGEWVSRFGRTQMRLAETEKYPHVTFFLNGGVEEPYDGEHRTMAPSPKVRTYDLAPEMAAEGVTQHLVDAIHAQHDLIIVNFANPDMVGHTGSLEAAIKACEAVDAGLGKALVALEDVGGAMLVTADHGNCERMIADDGGPHTAHTTARVPVILVGAQGHLRDGRLADLAVSLLDLMGIPAPEEMTGKSLLVQ